MSKYQGFEDIKIIKKCEKDEKIIKEEEKSCETLKIVDGNFLENVNEEILYVDDKIKINDVKLEPTLIKEEPQNASAMSITPDCFSDVPAKLKDQISLPISNIEQLSFYETFMISKNHSNELVNIPIIPDVKDIDEVGSSSIVVEETKDGNILLFMTQQKFENNQRKVLEILSVMTKDLKVVHEKIIKRKCTEKEMHEHSLHIIATDKELTLIKTTSHNGNVEQWKGSVNWTKNGDFLSRGANEMMMRKLAFDKFDGCVQSYYCNIYGDFAVSQYIFHPPENLKVFEKYMMVQRIDHLLTFDNGKTSKISSFYSSETGRLLKRMYSKKSLQIHINPLSDLPPHNFVKNLKDNWEDDLELMAMYFEYKSKRKEELKKKFESPCVKAALHDYINCLIKCKPKSIMNFTLEFMRKLEQGGNVQVLETFENKIQQN